MEPITLISTAIALATPYLIRTGEKIAETAGEDIWNWIKKPFTGGEEEILNADLSIEENKKKLQDALLQKVESDNTYRMELQNAVEKAQQAIASYNQQNINNHAEVEKQINVTTNHGPIQM